MTKTYDPFTGVVATDGALHVMDGFRPVSYDANLTMDGTAQSVALASTVASGCGRVHVVNTGATTEAIRFAFGTYAVANAVASDTQVVAVTQGF